MRFSTFMALAVATGTHLVLAEEAAYGPPIYPGRNHTGTPFNGSHPIFPTGTGRPTGIIGTGRPTGRPISKPAAISTSTCTEEGELPTTSTLVHLHTETDTVSGVPFSSFPTSLPSGINTAIASSQSGGEFSTLPSLTVGYGAPSSAAGGYGQPSGLPTNIPTAIASSLGAESSAPGYGKPITYPTGKPTGKPFPLPSGGFPIHTLNHTIAFPTGTGRPHPTGTGVSVRLPTGTGISTKPTNSAPIYGKPKPTPLDSKVKRAESLEDAEGTKSSHMPKATSIRSGFAYPSGIAHPSGVAHPSGHHGHPSGVAHPTNSRTKSFETRTKTKSAKTQTKTKAPEPTMY